MTRAALSAVLGALEVAELDVLFVPSDEVKKGYCHHT
jgi:hypothetical protein